MLKAECQRVCWGGERTRGRGGVTRSRRAAGAAKASLPSPPSLRAAQGCVEEAGGVEDEDARAVVVERAARDAVGGVRRGEGVVVYEDDASVALGGERELFVAAQRDDEERRRAAGACGPRLFVIADEGERVEHGAHAPADADDAEYGARRVRQRCRLQPFGHAVRLVGEDGEGVRARAQQEKLAPLRRLVLRRVGVCVFVRFHLAARARPGSGSVLARGKDFKQETRG